MQHIEVLNQYAAGVREFSQADLRGANFRGKDLSEANFSGADIRGADFSKANLRGSNFSGAKAGLQTTWIVIIYISQILLAAFCGYSWTVFQHPNLPVWQRLQWHILMILMASFAWILMKSSDKDSSWQIFIILFLLFGINVGFFFYLGVGIIANTVFCCLCLSLATHSIGVEFKVKVFRRQIYIVLAFLVLSYLLLCSYPQSINSYFIIGSFPPLILGIGLGWIIYEKTKIPYSSILSNSIGTSFEQANLTDADFSNASLGNTGIYKAIIIRTSWIGAKNIDYMRPLNSYLKTSITRDLAISGQGENQIYDYQNLNGIYLKDAELSNASFVDANLSQSMLSGAVLNQAKLLQTNLSKANLTRAKLIDADLTQAQLADAELSMAILTGACIEDWNITTHTCLDNIICKYVFMRNVPDGSNNSRHRKPDHLEEIFKDGDFADFIRPLTGTLDLYHNGNIDPRSIAVAFKRLCEEHPEANLYIIAFESRGSDKLLFGYIQIKMRTNQI